MKEIIAIVGAGGKTTLLHRLIKKHYKEQKKVLAITTTHMKYEEEMVISGKIEDIKEQLDTKGWCLAGTFDEKKGKISALEESLYRKACEYADIVVIEADGANHHTVKVPAVYEPVIPENVTKMIVVMGMMDIGRPMGEVVHRFGLLEGVGEEEVLTMEWVEKLAMDGYVKPWRKKRPDMEIEVRYTRWEEGVLSYYKGKNK
ncbi:MAG: putative selenium-dependent hydroxylase accessory protein YqeC [Lachnospiraceae bacterium]|nr:putative selenium-dependent hydroxylase accessory protein YqeC [Lachnospiraceae bacterium]